MKSLQKSRRQKAIRAAFLSLCLSCCCCDKTSPRLRFLWARHAVGRQGTPRAASPLVAAAAALFRRQRENRRESLTDEAGSIVVVETIDGIKKKKTQHSMPLLFLPSHFKKLTQYRPTRLDKLVFHSDIGEALQKLVRWRRKKRDEKKKNREGASSSAIRMRRRRRTKISLPNLKNNTQHHQGLRRRLPSHALLRPARRREDHPTAPRPTASRSRRPPGRSRRRRGRSRSS